MKKFFMSIFIFALTLLIAPVSFASDEAPDALRSAQVFAGMNINSCTGWLGFDRVEGETHTWISGNLELGKEDSKYHISYLVIDDVVIVDTSQGDDPLYGIPQNAVGEARNYNINISCYEDDNNYAAYGYFYTPLLEPGEPVIITLEPDSVFQIIEYSAPSGVDPNDLYLEGENGARYMYNSYYNGFTVWINPTEIFDYSIMDYDGNTYSNGSIDPLEDTNPGSGESMMSINLPEGVTEVIFNEYSYWSMDNQELKGTIYVDDVAIFAETYFMNMEEKGGSISIYYITNVKVTVMAWRKKGNMPIISVTNNCGGDNFCANIPNGYNKIVVLVTGGEVQENRYYISFSKWSW